LSEVATKEYTAERKDMVRRQLAARRISDGRILTAMEETPREEFVPMLMRDFAYDDAPIQIGAGQTISQPYIAAKMLALAKLSEDDVVLEIGAGSGYVAALAGSMCAHVFAVERHESLLQSAQQTLNNLQVENVDFILADGSKGLPSKAPFDAIIVSAACAEAPTDLCRQLSVGGRLVAPVSAAFGQKLTVIKRVKKDAFEETRHEPVQFVPLVAGIEHDFGQMDTPTQ